MSNADADVQDIPASEIVRVPHGAPKPTGAAALTQAQEDERLWQLRLESMRIAASYLDTSVMSQEDMANGTHMFHYMTPPLPKEEEYWYTWLGKAKQYNNQLSEAYRWPGLIDSNNIFVLSRYTTLMTVADVTRDMEATTTGGAQSLQAAEAVKDS